MVYLFAGKRRHSDIAAFLTKAERSGRVRLELHEFDIERSPQHDLTDSSLWDQIYNLLKEGNVTFDSVTAVQHFQQGALSVQAASGSETS